MFASGDIASNADASQSGLAEWNVARRAGQNPSAQARQALEHLCRTYRYAVYAYVHQQAVDVTEAERVTQKFFAWFLEERNLARLAHANGKFRSCLLAALRDYLAIEWPRGNGGETAFGSDSECIYDQIWALAVRHEALARLREEYVAAGKVHQFDQLKVFLSNDHTDWIAAHGISPLLKNPGGAIAVAVAADRLRLRYGELVRAQIARIVISPADLETEIQHLFEVFQR
ncbi:MAG: hypothetical protein DME24_25470 [Verrucomicrobia bacterium]|nr:MAG: hypothetical protein DME24_25470 [Verrucomicrobiota bacterium]